MAKNIMMQNLGCAVSFLLEEVAALAAANGRAVESGTERVEIRRNGTSARDSTRNGTTSGHPTLTAASH